jgi:hypothetical protein
MYQACGTSLASVGIGEDFEGTYSPEALNDVEVDIELGHFIEDGEVVLGLVQTLDGRVNRVHGGWILGMAL